MSEGVLPKTLAGIPLFAGLSEDVLVPLATDVRRITVEDGAIVCTRGEVCDTMYLVIEGRLKVYTHGPNEQEIVLDIIGPDQVLGELALIDGQPRSATVEALSPCTLLALDRKPFMAHLEAYPSTAIHLLRYLSNNLRQRVLQTEVTSVTPSAARLAHTILFLADRNGSIEPGLVTTRLNQKDIAAAIGTSEVWVSQMLGEWSREGIIGLTGARRLLLHDVEALRALSQEAE